MTSHNYYPMVYYGNRALRRQVAFLMQMLSNAIKRSLQLNTLLFTLDKLYLQYKIYYNYQYTDQRRNINYNGTT